ncbi:alpha/beta hydrolase [Dermatophilaceae bacterium Soc4.6]
MTLLEVNGTSLFFELRGQGPPLLMIPGSPGDSGHLVPVAELLADEFTVVTYDRRGNSRSPRPPRWTSTSTREQADDAAALLQALNLAPAAAFGISSGSGILAELMLRRPELLTGAVFHEPGFIEVTSDPDAAIAVMDASFDEGMKRGGPKAALETFARLMIGAEIWDAMDPSVRDRLVSNVDVFFEVEGKSEDYLPTRDALRQVRLPCVVLAGQDNRPPDALLHFFYEASQWLADALGVPVTEVPGAHAAHASHPEAFAAALRDALRGFGQHSQS